MSDRAAQLIAMRSELERMYHGWVGEEVDQAVHEATQALNTLAIMELHR